MPQHDRRVAVLGVDPEIVTRRASFRPATSRCGEASEKSSQMTMIRSGTVRQLRRYYRGAMTSCRPSHRTSLPSFGGTSAFTRSFRSLADECAAWAWSW
jgi:hypothetical protein